MNIQELTKQVVAEIKKEYYLVPREKDVTQDHIKFTESVINFVCDRFGLSVEKMKSPTKTAEYSLGRYMIYRFVNLYSPKKIDPALLGALLGRDRTSVISALLKTTELLQFDRNFRINYNNCETAFKRYYGHGFQNEVKSA